MLVTLDVKEIIVDEFMQVLKQFSNDDLLIQSQSFLNEKERMQ